jgi:UDP-N-acetylmuramoyl-tripeptide--D-alanyl-D-alanine ligase
VGAICSSFDLLAQSGLPGGLVVRDPLEALQTLAARWRRQFHIPLIAVTGSNGKTTVTQMISAILGVAHEDGALATVGNLNNHIGVPLTLLRMRPQHRAAVVELGMNHPNEIARLGQWSQPTVALVNNAQREHQEFLLSVRAVALENGAVFESLPDDGVAVFPADDDHAALWSEMARSRRCMTFSSQYIAGASVSIAEAKWAGGYWNIVAQTPRGSLEFALKMVGEHNVRNALAALTCCMAAGVSSNAISRGLGGFQAVAGRSRLHAFMIGGRVISVVDDTYNANPDSVLSAIKTLASLPGSRCMILGDMGEVGDQGVQFHEEVGAFAARQGIELLLTCGELSVHAARQFNHTSKLGEGRHFGSVQEVISLLDRLPLKVNSILVKGSRFMRMERVFRQIQQLATAGEGGICS